MLTIILILINIAVSILGIYIFDYSIDSMINNPLVIILSFIAGTIIMVAVASLYIELFYLFVAKKQPVYSMKKHKIANQFMAIPLIASNYRIKVEGLEKLPQDSGFTIYSNHTSMMDIPVLMVKLNKYPVAFLAKKMVGDLIAIGKWTKALGCVMLDRENTRKGAEAIIQVIKNVKSGSTMVIFPEGTRTREVGSLREFKPGAFKVALKSKKTLVPISIIKPSNFRKVKWPFPKRMKIIIHEPLKYDDIKGLNTQELSQKVRSIIEEPLKELGE